MPYLKQAILQEIAELEYELVFETGLLSRYYMKKRIKELENLMSLNDSMKKTSLRRALITKTMEENRNALKRL